MSSRDKLIIAAETSSNTNIASGLKSTVNDAIVQAQKMLDLAKNDLVSNVVIFILIAITAIILIYVFSTIVLPETNCNKIKSWFPLDRGNGLTSIPSGSEYLLRDYYIKASWNSCLSGIEKHDFVNFCGLDAAIRQGCRFLDFQIFTLNGQPIVGFGNKNNIHQKDSYNALRTNDILQRIMQNAFSSSVVQNFNDPLILHFRFYTEIENTYNILASQIKSILNDRILGRTYSNGFSGKNLGAVEIKNFFGKIIIFVDGTRGHGFEKTKLWEYVNMVSGSPFLSVMSSEDLRTQNTSNILNQNKQNMMISYPSTPANYNIGLPQHYGVQISAMNYFNNDSFLEQANSQFKSSRYAFDLKPESQRYIPVTFKTPPISQPKTSFQPRKIETDYYSITI